MRSSKRHSVTTALLIAWSAVSLSSAAGAVGVSTCLRQEEVFFAETHAVPLFNLSHRQIIAESETVFVDGEFVERGFLYDLDYARGILKVNGGLLSGSCLRVTYRVFPFALKGDYTLRSLDMNRREGAARPAGNVPADEQVPVRSDPGYSLRASGSKTVAMEAGSLGGVKVDQSLSLSLGGSIGNSVSVVGVLSDRDFGFDQAGQTQKLKDLDKVFIEVSSPRATARVGDIEMAQAPGELLRFERSMTGFYASASRGESGLRASAASSRTVTESVLIEGREGISGPYVVTGPDGLPVMMVPNKERVWVDGIPMQRGKGMDYTVDYSSGALYFNPSRFIRERSRIVVDYEVQEYDGGRQFYFAGSDLVFGGNSKVGITVVNERFSPAALAAAEEMPGSSVNLGTGGDSGWEDGGRYVGPGNGDFVRAEQDSAYFYEYVGDFTGDYQVVFTRVEDGKGDYEYVFSERWQKNIYLYTGLGGYVAMIGPSPELSSQVVHLAASGSIGENIEIRTEGALSKAGERAGDGDWEDIGDGAYSVRLRGETALPALGGLDVGAVEFEVKRRSVGASYQTFGRIRNPDFIDVWGMKPTSVYEETDGLNLGYKWGERIRADAGFGRMETDAGKSQRRHARVTLGRKDFGLTAMTDVVDVDSETGGRGILRRGVDLRLPVRVMSVNLGDKYEERILGDGPDSFRRNEVYSELRFLGGDQSLSLRMARTGESRIGDAGWADYSTVTEGRVELEAQMGTGLQMRAVLGQSRIVYAEKVGPGDLTSTACDIAVSLRDLYMLSALTVDYGLSNTLTTIYESELIEVGSGGDCDSLGNYVENGGYTISRREAGRAPVTRLRSRLQLETGKSGKILHARRFTTRTEIAVEGESVDEDFRRAAFPLYGDIMYSPSMMLGRITASEQIVLNRIGKNTISADLRGTRGQDRRCEDRAERFAQDLINVRLVSNSFDRVTLSLSGELRSSRRSIGTGSQAVERNIKGRSVRMDLERPLWRSLRALLGVELAKEESTVPAYDITEADFSPGLTLFAGSLRCDARVNVRRILSGETPLASGYSKRNSLDWSTRMSFNHTRYTSLSLEYTGRRLEQSPAIHNVRASVNATF